MMSAFSREKNPIARAVIPTRVLVVDDEPLIRWSICSALAAHGFDAVAAADGLAARRIAAEWPPPRVVLLDRTSSDPACLEVLADIRALYPDCRFVVMTTKHGVSLRPIFGAGVEQIVKPFDLQQVVRLVTQLAIRDGCQGDAGAPRE